jgi:hypothetical protein
MGAGAGGAKAAKTVNKKNIAHFKAQLDKAKQEKQELDRVSTLAFVTSQPFSANSFCCIVYGVSCS